MSAPSLRILALCLSFLSHLAVAQTNLPPLWWTRLPAGKVSHGAAVSSDGTIYVTASGPGDALDHSTPLLHALTPEGAISWTFNAGKATGIAGPPTVGPDGTIYFGTRWGADNPDTILAVRPDGTERWRCPGISQGGNLSVGADNQMLATGQGESLYRLDQAGTPQTLYTAGLSLGNTDGAPVVAADGTVYFWESYHVTALTPEGSPKWNFQEEAYLSGISIGPDGSIYVASGWGQLCALNPDGTRRWCVDFPGQLRTAPTIGDDGCLWVPLDGSEGGTSAGQLVRLDREGRMLSTNNFSEPLWGAPALAMDGTAWLVDGKQYLNLLSPTGQILGKRYCPAAIPAPVLTAAGLLIVTTETNGVIVFRGPPPSAMGWPMAARDQARSHRDTSLMTPTGPSTILATTNGLSEVTVTWEAPGEMATYELWRSPSSELGRAVKLAEFLLASDGFTDTNAAAGAPYYYWVRPRNSAGFGPFCGPAMGNRSSEARESWRTAESKMVPMGIAVSTNGTTYVAASWPNGSEGSLYALNSRGEQVWAVDFPARLGGGPVLDNAGNILVVTDTEREPGLLQSFNPEGKLRWTFADPCDFHVPIITPGGDLLLASEQRGPISGTRYGRNRYLLTSHGAVKWASTNGVASYVPFPGVPPLLAGEQQFWLPTWRGIELSQVGSEPAWSRAVGNSYPLGIAPAPGGAIYVVAGTGLHIVRSDGSIASSMLTPHLTSGPVLGVDGTLYLGTDTNALVACRPDGTLIWAAPAEGSASVPAAVGKDGSVFFGTDSGFFYAVNADGSLKWEFKLDGPLTAAPTLNDNQQVILGTASGRVWALRADTSLGQTPWPKYQGNVANQGRTEGRILPPDPPGAALQLEPSTATIRFTWGYSTNAWWYEVWRGAGEDLSQAQILTNVSLAEPFVDQTSELGVTYSYWVRSANPAGKSAFVGPLLASQTNQFWMTTLEGTPYAPAVSTNGTVYLATDRELVALSREGQRLWSFEDGSILTGAPAITPEGSVIIHSTLRGGSVHALAQDGRVLWTCEPGQYLAGDPAVDAYGTIYCFGMKFSSPGVGNYVLAIDKSGKLLWAQRMYSSSDVPAGHPVVDEAGLIYGFVAWGASAYRPTGASAWSKSQQGSRWSNPSLNSEGELVCFFSQPYRHVPSSLTMTSGGAVVSSNSYTLSNWAVPTEPVIARDGTAFFCGNGNLICLERSGALRWAKPFAYQSNLISGPLAVPALDRLGNLYVLTKEAVLALSSSGEEFRRWEIGAPPTAPPILTLDGRLYVAAGGRLYAFKAVAGLDPLAPWPVYRQNALGTASRQITAMPVAAPVVKSVIPFPNKVRVESEAPSRTAILELYRSTTPVFDEAVLVAQSALGQWYADDTSATPGLKYWYWARFTNSSGVSPISGPVSAATADLPVNWFLDNPTLSAAPPAIGPEGNVYCFAGDRLLALSSDSETKWELSGAGGGVAIAPEGSVFAVLGSGLYCLSHTGQTNWFVEGVSPLSLPPSVGAGGRTPFAQAGGELVAYSPTGEPLWESPPIINPCAPVSINRDGRLVVATTENKLAHIAHIGTTLSTADLNFGPSGSAPVLDEEGTAYLLCRFPAMLVAVRPDGSEKWRLPFAQPISSTAVVAPDGTVFTAYAVRESPALLTLTTEYYLAAIATNGAIKWKYRVSVEPSSPVLTADDGLIFTSGTNVIALQANDGVIRWQMESPNRRALGTPMLDLDGSLYLPMVGGLLSVKTPAGPAATGWPMFRQNPRQSASLESRETPQLEIRSTAEGAAELRLAAPAGAVLLRSRDLVRWERCNYYRQTTQSIPLPIGDERGAFYRAVAP